MLIEGLQSKANLIKLMQLEGDFENAWVMFDYMKHVKE